LDFWNWDIKIQSAIISAVVAIVICMINLWYNKKRDKETRKNVLLDTFKKDFLAIQDDAIRLWYTEPYLRKQIEIQLLQSKLSSLLKDYQSKNFEGFYNPNLRKTRTDLVIECRRCFTDNIESDFDTSKENHLTEMVDKIFQSLNIR
jgi:hypothetical protein